MGLALRSKQPVFLHRCSKNDADKTSSAVWRKKDCCSHADVSCSQSHCCRKGSGGPAVVSPAFFYYMLSFFSRNSPHHTQGLSGRLSGESELIFRQSGLCTGTSPGKKREAVKKISFIFSLPRPAVFLCREKDIPPERVPFSSQFHAAPGPVPSECAALQP